MPLLDFDQLHQLANERSQATPVAVAGGADGTVLTALRTALDRGWALPLVVGDRVLIQEKAEEAAIDLHGFELIDASSPAEAAVEQVRSGRAQMLMKGQVATPALMSAILDEHHGLRTDRTIAQVVLMQILAPHRRFLLADTGICVQPTLAQRLDICRSVVEIAHALQEPNPHIAWLAASEAINDKMPETGDAQQLVTLIREDLNFPHCIVDGPLSFDLAYAAEAASRKNFDSPVYGNADAMLFPNLLAANLTVKAIMYTSDCHFGGVLTGTRCPVVFMSRADSVQTRLDSLAFALNLLPT
jgi:phosphotransacetylase